MDTQWHYIKDNKTEGPVSIEELQALFSHGFITEKTKVWTNGLPGWVTASEIENMVPKKLASVPAINPETVPEYVNFIPEGKQVRPWIRLWARWLDLYVFSIILGFIVGVMSPQSVELVGEYQILFAILFLMIFPFFEAIMLSLWGTTVGKYAFNIRVTTSEGHKLAYESALRRSFRVWFTGLGLGIPVVMQIAMFVGYRQLRQNKISPWDANTHSQVLHRKISSLRVFFVVMIFVLIFAFILITSLL